MNREERIERARRMAADHAPAPADKLRQRGNRLAQRLLNVGASQAQRHVDAAVDSGGAAYLEPASTPGLWDTAVELARMIAISRAKRRDTVTSAEIKWAIFDEFRVLMHDETFETMVQAMKRETDGVLLGSIVVDPDTGRPSDDFLLAAMEAGIDLPVEALQRQVYEHFR